jgi:ABC-type iron transport system FetAB ATPase subunit
MMLDEIFEALKTDEEKNVQDILMWYFYTVFK